MTVITVDKSLLSMETEGVLKTSLMSINKTIGGLGKTHKTVIIHSIPAVGDYVLQKSLLEIVSITRDPLRTKWRIWFDGVPITREYKPNYIRELSGSELGITIIDVSPIVKRDLKRMKHKAVIINEGSEPIFLLSSMMTKVLNVKNAFTKFSYFTGGFTLDRNSVMRVKSPFAQEEEYEKKINLITYSEDYPTILRLACKEHEKEINMPSMINEITHSLEGCVNSDYIDLSIKTDSPIKPVIVPSVLLSVEKIQGPVLSLEIKEAKKNNNKIDISIEITNKGKMSADNIILTLLTLGTPVYRKKIRPLNPGDNVVINDVVRFPSEARVLVARIIWNEFGEPRFIEKKLKF